MFRARLGKVKKILARQDGISEILVDLDGEEVPAINYDVLTGQVEARDEVVLNTTAMELSLGTGGFHFVLWNLSRKSLTPPLKGHIMKLRYTPLQLCCLTVEEEKSHYKELIEKFRSLEKMPILIGGLHSLIAGAAAGVKAKDETLKVTYIMTDWAALPIGFSRLVHQLKDKGLLDCTITCGQAFGGDYEAVNIYTALICAKEVAKTEIAIVAPGPGLVGTGTKYGFTAIHQGEIVNAVNILGGAPVVIPRLSFKDKRERHFGISHHTLTALSEIALTPAVLCLPQIEREKTKIIFNKLKIAQIHQKHKIVQENGADGLKLLQSKGIEVTTMGRTIDEEPEFFLAACAAGTYAAKLTKDSQAQSRP